MKIKANEENVKILGRTIKDQDVLYLNYTCSSIEFEFTGTKVEAVLWTDGEEQPEMFQAYVAVFINDEMNPSKRIKLEKKESNYLLYESEKPVTTKIKLMKMSEAAFAKVGVKGIAIEGSDKIKPTTLKKRKIEFIGDSITCGYGNEGVLDVDNFTTEQENPWDGYAAKTARYFDAEFQCISWSGIGILSSWTEDNDPKQDWLMPMLYQYTDIGLEKTLGHSEYEIWDNKKFEPDVIVINLGTNDTSYTQDIPERIRSFGEVYYQFIDQVRSVNQNAKIICTLGVMGQELLPEIEYQVKNYQTTKNDKNVYVMAFEVQKEEDGIGADSHPSLKTHDIMSKKLIQYIKNIMTW